MIRGTGPPPPLGELLPNGIDTSQPTYTFKTVTWSEPPHQFQFHEGYMNLALVTARKQNDQIYKAVGNTTSWNQYIVLGYHVYDNCFQFDTQWKQMQKNNGDALKFIWFVYSYHLSHSMEIPTTLAKWANDIAKPYLEENRPETLNPNTDDPRKACRHYDEPDQLETDELEQKMPAAEEWKGVGKKTRNVPAVKDAIQTPLPYSPNWNKQQTNETNTIDLDQPRQEINYVHLNDGTLCIAVKWKPKEYDRLFENKEEWNLASTDLIHFMLDAVRDDATIHPWVTSTTIKTIPSLDLNPDKILDYIAPKVTPMLIIKTLIFSFRACFGTGPGRWMNNPITKKA